jgi:septal ring factor EnvC (AmiA/AmiB activator)
VKRALLLFLLIGALIGAPAWAGRPPEAIDAERAAAEAEVRDLERRARALEEQQTVQRARLRQRLLALYKLSNGGLVRLLAGATSVAELDARREAVSRVVARDLAELASLREEARELDLEQARRKEALARAIELGSQVALADVADATGLQLRQGRLTRPVAGAIAGSFGLARDPALGVELVRQGIELRSHAGEPVRACASGHVRWIGDVPGLGRGLAIDHGDGYLTLTARLDDIAPAVGDQVSEGMRLGRATGPTIYFELAQAATPIDPSGWLAPR